MSTIEFFDYLASSEATHDLALELADAWAEQQVVAPRIRRLIRTDPPPQLA